MRKVISIGESVLDTVFVNRQPVKAMVGGKFDKNDVVFSTDWDFVIVDEAHQH